MLWVAACLGPAARAAEPEKPAIYDVDFEFEGNAELSSGELRDALSPLRADLRREGVEDGSADDAAYEVQRHYESQGFRKAVVSATWWREADRFFVRFRIQEGPRSFVEEVDFRGNRRFDKEALEKCFVWRRTGVLGVGKTVLGDAIFTDDVAAEGVSCVIDLYQLEGFFFAEARSESQEDAEGKVRVRVEVTEGPRVVIRETPRLEGVRAFPEGEVRSTLDISAGEVFVPRLPLILKSRVLDFYRNRGYRFVEVEVEREIDREAATALLTIRVEEGPLTRINAVNLTGNEKTYDWVLRNRIRLEPGDLYSEERIRESYRSLLRSGLFSAVSMETSPVPGSDDLVDLDVNVSEKSKYKLGFLAGWGSYELIRGKVFFENINLFGTGHRARLEAMGSLRGEGVSGEYLNPFFFHEQLSHKVEGFFEIRENPSFDERQFGADNAFSYRATDNLRITLSHRLRESEVSDASAAIPPELVQDALISSVSLSNVVDLRNSIVDPERGSTHRLTVEYGGPALGSELDFARFTGQTSLVVPLGAGFRVVGSFRAGIIIPLQDTEVIPLQERFFSGGDSSIRSFERDEAGPKVNGDPIGGEAFTTYNLELRFPLLVAEELRGAIFGDMGTVNEFYEDFGGGRYFFAVGVGIRYNTPVGPLRVDAAFNPDRQDGEDFGEIHFGLGYPF
jgi:outer membrane protein assembly complex protein YaeT